MMRRIRGKLSTLNAQHSQLSVREKAMVLIVGLVLIIFMGFNFIIEPKWLATDAQKQEIKTMSKQLAELNQNIQTLQQALEVDVNAPVKQQIEQLNRKLSVLDKQLIQLNGNFISAVQMTEALAQILSQTQGIKINAFRNIPSVSVEQAMSDTQVNKSEALLYQHGIQLEIDGDYNRIHQFLSQVESLPWGFYWQNFEYEVQQYPDARLSVEMMSLSVDEAFLGL